MPKTSDIAQIELFETTDDVACKTFRAKDDIEFATSRRRRSKAKAWRAPRVPETGPHCQRCRNWLAPMNDDVYGACRVLGVVGQRVPHRNLEKGEILAVKDADALRVPVELLRTAAWGSCSLFEKVKDEAA